MKLLLFSILSLGTLFCQAQKLGFFMQGNTGSIWVKNPQREEDGTFGYQMEDGFGGGFSFVVPLSERIEVDYRLCYTQKGFRGAMAGSEGAVSELVGPVTIQYVGLSQMLKVYMKPDELYILAGLGNKRKVADDLPEKWDNPQTGGEIARAYYNVWAFEGIAGLGYNYDRLYFEGGMNIDIAPSLKTSDTQLRSYVWFANMGFRAF